MPFPSLRSSPSFIIGILLVVILGGLYVWRWTRPHPRGASDLIVRDFVTAGQQEVRACRRALERAVDGLESGGNAAGVQKTVDDHAAEFGKKLEDHAHSALDRLGQIAEITLKTEQNRRTRIRNRLREMKDVITEMRDEATKQIEDRADHGAK